MDEKQAIREKIWKLLEQAAKTEISRVTSNKIFAGKDARAPLAPAHKN